MKSELSAPIIIFIGVIVVYLIMHAFAWGGFSLGISIHKAEDWYCESIGGQNIQVENDRGGKYFKCVVE